uniref:hypothetical protein n=1 Tax=Croceitalea sp. MTPC5 TaxID=3056565 RepID=UPI0030CF1F63
MGKSLSLLLFLFTALMGFSQTTVTLQDQCNCEVLRGTDVSSPGATMPTGADTGDIYVNTTSGTIFYWDGDSWELTATDDQQLTGFTFNDATNQLTLDLENGGSVNVDLSSLSDTFSDTNTTITSFDIDSGTNSLVITDSDTNTFSVALAAIAAIVDTDNQDATEVALNGALDVDGDGNDETTVQEAIADLAAITETVTNLVDNNDGTITYTNEDGTPQTINKSDLTDNGNGTFTFDNGDGAAITFVGTDDQDATEVALNGVLDVDGDGNDETTVQEAIADLAAITETVTNLIDNNDGTITYTNEDGTPQTINKSDLTDNGN